MIGSVCLQIFSEISHIVVSDNFFANRLSKLFLLIFKIITSGKFSATSHFSQTSSNLANCRFGGFLIANLYMDVADNNFANCGNLSAN